MNRYTTLAIGITLCLCAIFGVTIEGLCIFYKIPDMNMPIGQSFTHVLDTIIGGLIGAFVGPKAAAAILTPPAPTQDDLH